jgi:eukaryotic-like serine/threonine-protein kinase
LLSPSPQAAPTDAEPGRGPIALERIGKYEIIKEVGRGSTGVVYLSHDAFYGRDVAIKVYNFDTDRDAQRAAVARKMFLAEAHLVGRLQHPNILPIYDAGAEGGHCYVVTEFVHGARTLGAYCRPDNLLRLDDVVAIVHKCARALAYAHSRGVIHRDIKPSNIMLTVDSDVRIIDFGVALVAGSDLARFDGIAGSPSYMSPEQVQSQALTHRSDLYSLGAVMYELLAGRRPFRAANLSKLLHQIVYATPAPLHTLRPDMPEIIEQVVARALAKEAGDRFQSAQEFAAELTRAHQELRAESRKIDRHEELALLRRLPFFHDFSHGEIAELMLASHWDNHPDGTEIVREGERDDRFYVVVDGEVAVVKDGREVGRIGTGEGFGESGYLEGGRRQATIRASGPVTVLRVSASQLEQVSTACQLRFNKTFLRTLLHRLQGHRAGD